MKIIHKYLLRDAFFCLVLSIIMLWTLSFILINISILNPFTEAFKDFSFLDIYYSEKMEQKNPASDIVVINIEQRDRFEITQLVAHIQKQQPKALGLDIIFKNVKDPYIDSLLVRNLMGENVVLSKAFLKDHWDHNAPIFKPAEQSIGYSNLNFDLTNNVIRTFEGKKEIDQKIHYSFSSLVSQKFLDDKWQQNSLENKLSAPIYINYHGSLDDFFTLSYNEAMNSDLAIIKDKIVLLGYLGTPHGNLYDIEDKFFTPLNKEIAGKSPPDMFGVLVHANIINMIIQDDFFKVVPLWVELFVALLLSYIGIAIFMVTETQNLVSQALIEKITQLTVPVLLLWFSLWLFKNEIIFKPEIIIAVFVLSIEFIEIYILIVEKLNTKYQWKSYFFH